MCFLVFLVIYNCYINVLFCVNIVVMILNNEFKGGCDDCFDIVVKRIKLLIRRCVLFFGRFVLLREK